MEIGTNFNMYANIEINAVVVATVNASIDVSGIRIQIGVQVIDKVVVAENTTTVQERINEFKMAVQTKCNEFGLPIML